MNKIMKNGLTRKEVTAMINSYLLDCVDSEGYGVTADTDLSKVNFVMDTFTREYVHNNNSKLNKVHLFAEWLQGLPSSFNIEYRNFAIIEIAEKWSAIAPNASEKQQDKICDNWFNYIANKFFQLHTKLNKVAAKQK